MSKEQWIAGGCHCGAVRYRVRFDSAEDLDDEQRLRLTECNCSVCSVVGFLHWIVPKTRFELISGDEVLREYRFGTKAARHLFCGTCGVKPYYVPRSHPDGFSVNLRCVDADSLPAQIRGTNVQRFDGRNWEDNIAALRRST